MAEIRVEIPNDEMDVLDGYCSAAGGSRTDVMRELLAAWAERKLHEATIILRVAGRTPIGSESGRSASGKPSA